ncbi:MAG: hypothetical protein S4CHLAM45_04940 [Chlamydiales bacterium]|nr:hypothetical protein [Chlamydiales bacterium]MCH9619965.1 hypothetical protein [Chlamydiales bacterium]MCH9622608.1 hypothetical protein [Chlamydiales bacterium]
MDLELKDVSDLLNVSESTIHRWISEGKIPAYQIDKQYRFSRSEIEDWLITQKVDLPDHEAVKSHMQFSLYRGLYRGDVLTDVPGETKEEIFAAVLHTVAKRFDLDSEVLQEFFLDREQMMPTGLGHGVAVPHTRDFFLSTHYDMMVVAYPKQPIDYGSLDSEPVHTLFFLFAQEDRTHLNLLSKIAHLSANEKTRAFYRTRPSKQRLLDFIKHWESALS